MVVSAEREFLVRINEAAECQLDTLAVMVEVGASDFRKCSARREDLLLLIVARLDGDLGLPQNRQACRIRLGRRRVISEAEKCAAHSE